MEQNPESQNSKVIFKNQPRLLEYEMQQENNKQRLELVPQVESFIIHDELFKNKEVSVEFLHTRDFSLVCRIEAEAGKYILKIPLGAERAEGEVQFLREWENAGVSVPHVHREGMLGGKPYILMNHIDAPSLDSMIEAGNAPEDVCVDIGKTLQKMHTPQAEGYGRIENGKPLFKEFKEWILRDGIQKRIKASQELGLLDEEHGSVQEMLDTLIAYSEKNPESAYCHHDLGTYNMLATDPLTVLDPDPMINNGIIDIGRSIFIIGASAGSLERGEQLKEGYFSGGKHFDAKALQASILLSAYMKLPNWHKKSKVEQIENAQRYLEQTSHFL